MSNIHKEWELDRKEEAWESIILIAEISNNNELDTNEKYNQIVGILKEYGWI